MENSAQQSGMDSVHGASVFSSVLFVTVAAMVAATALCLLPGTGISQMVLPERAAWRWWLWLWCWVFRVCS